MSIPRFPYDSVNPSFEDPRFADLASSPTGQALWAFLVSPHVMQLMENAVRQGRSPVAEISGLLLDEFGLPRRPAPGEPSDTELTERERFHQGLKRRFGPVDASDARVRQMIGAMVRPILEALGCPLRSSDVQARDQWNVFTTSARYAHPDPAPGSRPAVQATNLRVALREAFEALDGDTSCGHPGSPTWHVHGPRRPKGIGKRCTNHPIAVHKTDPHGILTFRDGLWPESLLGAIPRPNPHNFGRMSLIATEATIQAHGGPGAYAAAVVAELRRLGAW